MLPVWISAYRFQNKQYRVMVNAQTGEVSGDRPYSKAKIAIVIVATLSILIGGLLFANSKNPTNKGQTYKTIYRTRTYKKTYRKSALIVPIQSPAAEMTFKSLFPSYNSLQKLKPIVCIRCITPIQIKPNRSF